MFSFSVFRCGPRQYVSEGKSVFTEDEARVVFGNVALLTNYNKALLKDLRARIQARLRDNVHETFLNGGSRFFFSSSFARRRGMMRNALAISLSE